MSYDFFAKNYTPLYKYARFDAIQTTGAVWTPATGRKLVLTGLTITNNAAAGTFLLFIGSSNVAPAKIAQFTIGASATIVPVFGPIDGSAANYILFMGTSSGGTDGSHVFATGFEVEQ